MKYQRVGMLAVVIAIVIVVGLALYGPHVRAPKREEKRLQSVLLDNANDTEGAATAPAA